MPLAPFVGRCECDRDDSKMLVWMPMRPGNNYARCYSCGAIRHVVRTYEGTEGHPHERSEAVAPSEGDSA